MTARAMGNGLDWLLENQAESGELPTYAGPIEDGVVEWTPDSLVFITALVALACADIDDPRAVRLTDRAVAFVRAETEDGWLWRYWTRDNDQHDFTPRDADVIACCSMAVELRDGDPTANIPRLMANRDAQGRFHTWLLPRRSTRSPRYLWAIRDELRSSTRALRSDLWASTEASPDDVDAGVNLNVFRYLGPDRVPEEAVRWVLGVFRSGQEDDCDHWYRNRFIMYAFVADAYQRGIAAFGSLRQTVIERIVSRVDASGSVGTSLDTALALLALQDFEASMDERAPLRQSLLDAQASDGSWHRSIFYFGGPLERFGWGSEALATAFALQALAREQR